MRFHAALVLLMSLAAATATSYTPEPTKAGTPAPTTKPGTPAPTTKPGTPAPTTKPGTPAPTTKPGTPGPTTKPGTPGGGKGDPIMTGLDGRSFEFFGKAGSVYNVLSEKNHQVAMKLKEGHMWDHEGSYMSAIGFRYLDHTVEISNVEDVLSVTLDGDALAMRPAQTEQEVILGLAQGEMQLLWQLHRADYGNAVELTTDLLQLIVWVTPAGTRDEGGKLQPAYLNFDLTLLSTPAHNAMEGIVGETYAPAVSGAAPAENDFLFHGVEAEYEMASLFETVHAKSVFGRATGGKGRKLIEASFPMRASTRGFSVVLRASSQGLIKGRKTLH